MSVYQRDAVYLSGVPVFYSFDSTKCEEVREIEQIVAMTIEGTKRWGAGRLVYTESVAMKPADFPSPYLWITADKRIPWEERVQVRIGKATATLSLEYMIDLDVIREGDTPAVVAAGRKEVERVCRERWGAGKLVSRNRELRYIPKVK